MQQNKEYSDEDATWEALVLDRVIEFSDPPEFWASPAGYDHTWYKSINKKAKYKPGWHGNGFRGGTQISFYTTNNVRHRLYGPAIVNKKHNAEFWLKEGYFHRKDGPAYTHGSIQKWYYDGKLHRLDGPAILNGGGPKEYWINGQKLSPTEYKKEINRRKGKNHYGW